MLDNWGELAKNSGGKTVQTSMPCGLNLSQQRSKQHKLELYKGLTGGQSEKRAFGYFWTAYIVEPRLQYRPREVICHIKDITATLCRLSTVPE